MNHVSHDENPERFARDIGFDGAHSIEFLRPCLDTHRVVKMKVLAVFAKRS